MLLEVGPCRLSGDEGDRSESGSIEQPGRTGDASPGVALHYATGGHRQLNGSGRRVSLANPGQDYGANLADQARLWPTPMATDGAKNVRTIEGARTRVETGRQVELDAAVRLWPTPIERDWRSGKVSEATMNKNSRPLSDEIGGSLNPTWVEWLMGYPEGWTDLNR